MNLGGLSVIALLAFPPGADPEPKPDEPTSAQATPTAFQTQFTTHASRAGIRAVACNLHASLSSRPVDVTIDGVRCAAPSPNGHAMDIAFQGADVVLRLRVPEGTTTDELTNLDQGLHDIQMELARRAALLPQTVLAPPPIWTPPPDVKKGKRSTKWWIVTGVLAGVTGVASVIGGSVIAAGGQQNNFSVKNTGETILEVFVAPVAVATAITLTIAIILSAQGN